MSTEREINELYTMTLYGDLEYFKDSGMWTIRSVGKCVFYISYQSIPQMYEQVERLMKEKVIGIEEEQNRANR
jgi:hypothetical protein